ncbi:Protein kinase wis1 [Psilocybe cubensis]|uniref:mitogen-activated protein kinase kinase n=2 Tax=Psilocybe cubensis TaxID=181762 RepID=A0A8H8CP49_PSICU|nr:Protein kinase wis1 [Psilocybe cubensis]KAH9485104.1 Protein kinase wis1 [Psilocybe cubensis]
MSDNLPKRNLTLRQPAPASTPIPPSLQAKMAAFANRPPAQTQGSIPALQHPALNQAASFPPPQKPQKPQSMAARRARPNFSLRDIDSSFVIPDGPSAAGLGAGRPSHFHDPPRKPPPNFASPFSNFSKIVDPSGALNFNGKAVLHAAGVNFSNGASFAINMDQLQLDEELGKGNYGTVKKVLHKPTNVAMAMKEIRLELEDAKLNAIIMELDVLHRAVAPEIVEFYGAFFIESCVYYCMEYMDAGSLDKLQGAGVPEDVLARIASSMVRGLKFLKDDLNIIHRDVKPTNVLVNRKGEIKLCDFGISGELDKSLAKTNIGCQSYMAPERIKGESQNNLGTYTVSSDVWSLGLSMIEIGLGRYPYPPETYSNVFAQLTAIVHGDPPELDETKYSEVAREWVAMCLRKDPERRASYRELLEHPFLKKDETSDVNMVEWVEKALAHKATAALLASKAQLPQSV